MQRHDVASTLRLRYIYVMCLPGKCSTVLSTSLGKTVFSWRFILDKNILVWLTISCQKPFVFYVSVFCSQIFTQRLKLRPKVGLTYAISIVKWFFWILSKKIFFTFLCWIWIIDILQQYCENFRKKSNKWNLLKIWLQVPTLQISARFGFIFTMGKSENIWFFKNQ